MVYLSGPINGLNYGEATSWREYVTACFPPHIQGVSPMRAKRYLNDGSKLGQNPYNFPMATDRAINGRDHADTVKADAILVNLLGATTVSIGTAMEIAWAWDHKVHVVVAMEPEGNLHDHPMIRDCITVRVASLDEAIEAVIALVSPNETLMWNSIEQTQMLREEGLFRPDLEPKHGTYGGRTQ